MEQSGEDESITVNVRTIEFGNHEIEIPAFAYLGVLKGALQEITGVPVDRQRVLHRGRELVDNDATLQSLNVRDGMVLHMVSRPVPQAQSAPPGAQQPAPGAPPPVNIPGIPGIPGIPLADLLPPQVVAAIQRGEPIGPFNFSISTQPGAGPFGGHAGPHPHVHAGVSVTVAGGPVQGGAGPFNPHQLQSRRGPPSGRMRCPFPPPQNPDEPPLTAIGGLVGMLERLEVINMEHDPHPQVPLTTRADVHNPAYAAAWTETALVFLERSWGVLSGARLNRETLAAVNRVFEAAGLRPIPLGMVPSFPLDSFSDEDVAASAEDEPAASAPETGAPSVPAAAAPGSAPQQAQPARPAASVSDSESDGPPEVSDTEVEGEDSMPSLVDSELDHRVRWDEYEEDWVTDYGESEEDDASYAMSASAEEETDSEYLEDEYGDSEDEDDLPELMSISATSEGESESATSSNGGRGPGVQGQRAFGGASAQQRRQRRRQVLQRVSEDGFILVAAVTLGELTRRYMAALDLIPAARNANALVLRTAERLRSLATLEHGRAEILRQVRLVAGHLTRVAAVSAELGRNLQYLVAALGREENLFIIQSLPTYITYQGNQAVPNLMLQVAVGAPGGGTMAVPVGPEGPQVPRAPGMVPSDYNRALNEAAAPRPPAQQARAATRQPGGTAGQPGDQQQQQQQQRGQPPQQRDGAVGLATVSDNLREVLGVNSVEALQEMMSMFGLARDGQTFSILDAFRRLSVTSINVPMMVRDISNVAIAEVNLLTVQNRNAGAEGGSRAGPDGVDMATRIGEVVGAVVQRGLEFAFRRMTENRAVQAYQNELAQMGFDVSRLLQLPQHAQQPGGAARGQAGAPPAPRTTNTSGTHTSTDTGASQGAATPAPHAPSVPPSQRTGGGSTAAAPAPQAAQPTPAAAAAAAAEARAAATAAAPPPAAGPSAAPRGLGLGGALGRPRPKSRTTAAAAPPQPPARPEPMDATDTPSVPPLPAPEAAAAPPGGGAEPTQPTPAEPARQAAPAGVGAGGGLMGMMQSMMQNPAMMEMARSPSMQRAAEQLLGGAGAGATGGGGGLDIGSLLNAAGPILGQLMGGGVGGGVPGAGRAPGSNGQVGAGAEPEPLEVVLAKEMGEHDAAKWKECIESDRAKQAAEAGGTREKEFSEAYLAALPPRAAGGLLQSMLGEAADGE